MNGALRLNRVTAFRTDMPVLCTVFSYAVLKSALPLIRPEGFLSLRRNSTYSIFCSRKVVKVRLEIIISKGVDKTIKSEYNEVAFMNGHNENNDCLNYHNITNSSHHCVSERNPNYHEITSCKRIAYCIPFSLLLMPFPLWRAHSG